MKKRLLAIIATMALVVTMIPSMVFAAGGTAKVEGGAEYTSLTEAVANCNAGGKITITGEVEMMGVEGSSQTTDLKGITIVGSNSEATIKFVNYTGSQSTGTGTFSNMNLKNLKVVDETFYPAENGENAWEFTYFEIGGTNTFENVDFTDGIMVEAGESNFTDCIFRGHNNDSSSYGNGTMYGVWVHGGKAAFDSCTFSGTRGLKTHEQYGSAVDTVSVDNCVFSHLSEKPGVAIGTLDQNTTVSIKNSVFAGCQPGDDQQYIYESDTDTSKFNLILDNNEVGDYLITYDLAGGTVSEANPRTFDSQTNVTLNNPTREGYKFLGWTGSNGTTPQTTVTINGAGTATDLVYVANWEAIPAAEKPDNSPNTGDNSMAPIAVAGLALAAMAAVVATRRRTN